MSLQEKEKIVCEECDKRTQKDHPEQEAMKCETSYKQVTECMAQHKGQIAKCVAEWTEFKACHEKKNEARR